MIETTTSSDPYFVEGYAYAKAHWKGYALTYQATYFHLMHLRTTGELPKTTLAHVISVSKSATSVAGADNTKIDNPSIAGIVAGNAANLIAHPGDQIGKAIHGAPQAASDAAKAAAKIAENAIPGVQQIGDLASGITGLMSGKKHVLLRTAYIIFGGLSLLGGVALLARELGMKQVAKVAAAPLKPVKKAAGNHAK